MSGVWAVGGNPELGEFPDEGSALAAAWRATAPGGSRPSVFEKVDGWATGGMLPEVGVSTGILAVDEGIADADTLTIAAWKIVDGKKFGMAWSGPHVWGLDLGDEVQILAEIEVSRALTGYGTDHPSVRDLKKAMADAVKLTAVAHSVTINPGPKKSEFVMRASEPIRYRFTAHGTYLPFVPEAIIKEKS